MSAIRQPKADLVIASTVDPADMLTATVTAYGRHCRVSAIRNRRWIAGATLKRGEVAALIQGLSDLHATMIPEA